MRQFHNRLHPEFGLSPPRVHMQAGFLTGKEKEPESLFPEDCWTHAVIRSDPIAYAVFLGTGHLE